MPELIQLVQDSLPDAIGTLIATAVLAIVGLLYNKVVRKISVKATLKITTDYLELVYHRIKRNWRLVIALLLFLVMTYGVYALTTPIWAMFFSVGVALVSGLWTWHFLIYPLKEFTQFAEEFKENFQNQLAHWEYNGNWGLQENGNEIILAVTNSPQGGIAKPCLSWKDYVFEFETKIVTKNTSWIIRARDSSNYMMLQCLPDKVYPHFYKDGEWANYEWTQQNPLQLPISLPSNSWFKVSIEVRGMRVIVNVTIDGQKTTILDDDCLLDIPTAPQTYDVGSIGFRESDKECAHFRRIHVKKLR